MTTSRTFTSPSAASATPAPTPDAVPPLPAGTHLSRYVILDRVGSGGMGDVYAAYDPRLDRRIALKLLRADAAAGVQGERVRQRLIREAQSMARLQHPNVVTVHDAGEAEGRAYIAMEFVDGQDAERWRQVASPSTAKILEVYLAAGTGLAAAHAAKLVHRDFKPRNVLVGADGRVRVVDFGIAQIAGAMQEAAAAKAAGDVAAADGDTPNAPLPVMAAGDATYTPSGDSHAAIAGTPGYMAPEQARGIADVRSDVFSFCVSLYEALANHYPFPDAPLALTRDTLVPLELPRAANVPAHVEAALRKGMRWSPDERFQSMEALITALQGTPRRAFRAVGTLSFIAVTLFFAGSAIVVRTDEHRHCERTSVAATQGYGEAERARLLAAFAGWAVPGAAKAAERIDRVLTGHFADARQVRHDMCTAARVEKELSPSLLAKAYGCVDERLARARALVEVLGKGEVPVLERGVRAAYDLEGLRPCGDPIALAAMRAPVQGDAGVLTARETAARARALYQVGQYPAAKDALQLIGGEALAKDPALAFDRDNLMGLLHEKLGEYPLAIEAHQRAAAVALEAGADADAAAALAWKASALGLRLNRMEDARATLALAQVLAGRGQAGPKVQGIIHLVDGILWHSAGEWAKSADAYQAGITAMQDAVEATHEILRDCYNNHAVVLMKQAKYAESLADLDALLAMYARLYGEEHPEYAVSLMNRGNVLTKLARYDEAEAAHSKVIELRERQLGPDDLTVAAALNNRADALGYLRRNDEALRDYRRAIAIFEERLGPNELKVAMARTNLCGTLADMGQYEAAVPECRRAEEIFARGAPQHPVRVLILGQLAAAELGANQPVQALAHLETAKALRGEAPADPHDAGRLDMLHGQAVWRARKDAARARALLRAAEPLLASSPRGAEDLAALRSFVAQNPQLAAP